MNYRKTSHQKQNRIAIGRGVPNVAELQEAVPVLRSVSGLGIVEYIRFNGQLYSNVYSTGVEEDNVSYLHDGTTGDFSFPGTVSNTINDTTSGVQDDLASLAAKINEIIRALRNANILGKDGRFGDSKGA